MLFLQGQQNPLAEGAWKLNQVKIDDNRIHIHPTSTKNFNTITTIVFNVAHNVEKNKLAIKGGSQFL